MTNNLLVLQGHRVVVPGGTGGVGEGVVRQLLATGAEVLVPTRSAGRSAELRNALGPVEDDRLHLFEHDYTTFAGAVELAGEIERRLGQVDSVVAPIGGWWAGGPLAEMSETDWAEAFIGLATAHAAVLRAFLPRLGAGGAYILVVGDSALQPVPGSGLVSMEQAAILMMQRVVAAEYAEQRRVFAFLLGQVATRAGNDGQITADQVGTVATAALQGVAGSRTVPVHDDRELESALALLRG
ncbi:SDR family oxidoreductase [uncultured Jatrophihabitans sp.]|uniref:SDR family oxidoreductase n=1 Tax=uncultured Jatrophihabitans sp. TaxID=1610747 RepID=UPI0035CB242A